MTNESEKIFVEMWRSSPFISVITKIELLSWHQQTELTIGPTLQLIKGSLEIGLSRQIAEQTIAVRRQHRLKLPDAIIAATALHHNLTLVTHNVRDFARVEGLAVYDPMA